MMRAFVLALVALAIGSFVGCSVETTSHGGLLQVMSPTQAEPASTSTLVYACQPYPGTCVWYQHGSNVVAGTLSGVSSATGMAVDRYGNVYVANQRPSEVLVFAKGSTTATKTLSDPNAQPDDVAVDSNGTVYVANFYGPGAIAVYVGGSTMPTSYLNDPNFVVGVQSVAVDEHHLLAALYDDSNFQIDVDEFVGGKGQGTKVISTGLSGGAVRFDSADNLVLALDSGTGEINIYNGTTFALCNSTPQPGIPSYINLDRSSGDLYIPDVKDKVVHEVTFSDCTGGGTKERNYTAGLMTAGVISTAVDPGPGP